jgi:hypothetical protein
MDLLTGEAAAAPASPEKLPFERKEVDALEDDPGISDVCKAVLARVEGPAIAGGVDVVPEVEDTARRAGRCRGRACRVSTAISQLSDEAFDCSALRDARSLVCRCWRESPWNWVEVKESRDIATSWNSSNSFDIRKYLNLP